MTTPKSFVARGVVTYNGSLIGLEFGAPNVVDISVQCMRQCRFAGALREWWPVGMHQMLTADIIEQVLGKPELVLDCLLHDAPESVFGDTPTPIKTDQRRKHEDDLLKRIYTNLSIDLPSAEQHKFIKEADTLALAAESAELGHQAFTSMLEEIGKVLKDSDKVLRARALMNAQYQDFNPLEALKADGRHVQDYRNRLFKNILFRIRQP